MPNLNQIIQDVEKEFDQLVISERIKKFLSAKISEAVKGVLEEVKLNKQTECENKSEAEAIYYEQGYNTAVQDLEVKIAEISN